MESTLKVDPKLVFIDSSVFFSACYSSTGYARDLFSASVRGDLRLAVSEFVLAETRFNLAREGPDGLVAFNHYRSLEMIALAQPDQATVDDVSLSIEPKDAPVVAAAICCQAWAIATFDRKHLLAMATVIETRWGIKVRTPDRILDWDRTMSDPRS